MVQQAVNHLQEQLASPDIWGAEQAAFAAKKNDVYKRLIAARENLQDDMFAGEANARGRESLVANPKRIHSVLSAGDAATNDLMFKHLDEFHLNATQFRDFQEEAEKMAFDGVVDSKTAALRDQLADFRANRQLAEGFKGQADAVKAHQNALAGVQDAQAGWDEAEKVRQAKAAQRAAQDAEKAAAAAKPTPKPGLGVSDVIAGASLAHHLTSPVGWAILAGKAAKKLRSGAMAEWTANRLATLKHLSDSFDKVLERHADALVGVGDANAGKVIGPLVTNKPWTDEEYKAKSKQAAEAAANPDAMMDTIHHHAGGANDFAPMTFGNFAGYSAAHATMIAETLRPPQIEGWAAPTWTTSATERQAAQEIVQTIQDPLYAVQRLNAGTANPKIMAAWAKAWPHIAKGYQVKVGYSLSKVKDPSQLSTKKLNSLMMLGMGIPNGTYSPSLINRAQSVYHLKATQQGGPGSRGGAGSRGGNVGKINLSTQFLTPTQRAAQRAK